MGCAGSKAVSTIEHRTLNNSSCPDDSRLKQDLCSARLGSAGMDSTGSSDPADDTSTVADQSDWGGQVMSAASVSQYVTSDLPPKILPPLHSSSSATPNVTDEQVLLSSRKAAARAIAFEIPLLDGASLIRGHPPLSRRLENNQLTIEKYHGKHSQAAQRRQKILNQRVQSARSHHQRTMGRTVQPEINQQAELQT